MSSASKWFSHSTNSCEQSSSMNSDYQTVWDLNSHLLVIHSKCSFDVYVEMLVQRKYQQMTEMLH